MAMPDIAAFGKNRAFVNWVRFACFQIETFMIGDDELRKLASFLHHRLWRSLAC